MLASNKVLFFVVSFVVYELENSVIIYRLFKKCLPSSKMLKK